MGARRRKIQAQSRDNLAKLLHHVIALDEQMSRQQARARPGPGTAFYGAALNKMRIPRQENPAFQARLAEQIVILTGKILGIKPQDAQPAGQSAQHRIGQESRRLTVLARGSRITLHILTLIREKL
jgi:hypothetical protein